MCGHFLMVSEEDLDDIVAEIQRSVHVNALPDWPAQRQPARDAFPGAKVPLVVGNAVANLAVQTMSWGFPLSWKKGLAFNTRIETALGSPDNMWRESLDRRRCIIPVWGFFEPHRTETVTSPRSGKQVKRQYLFSDPDRLPLFIAGIHDQGRFSLLTTAPNDDIVPIHDRMPLILRLGELRLWLAGDYASLANRNGVALSKTSIS